MLVSKPQLLLLAAGACCSAAQLTFPSTVEFDLIFPRNGTFSPTARMPIVFAIQNSQYAVPLDVSFSYAILKQTVNDEGEPDSELINGNSVIDLTHADITSSGDAYFAIDSLIKNITEGNYTMLWTLMSTNCSHTKNDYNEPLDGISTGPMLANNTFSNFMKYQSAPMEFTIKNGAQFPDLVAATADDACADSGNLTLEVTGTLNVSNPDQFYGRTACAVLPTPLTTPPANPCAAKINSSVASSISAALVSCALHHPNATTGCIPKETNDGSGKRGRISSFAGIVSLVAASTCLLYLM